MAELQTFKATESEVYAYECAARASGVSKSEWIRIVLAAAAGIPFQGARIAPIEARNFEASVLDRGRSQSFRASPGEIKAYKQAAQAVGMKSRPWIRLILAAAAGLSDLTAQMARVSNVQSKPVTDGEW